ncbi:hypothetical protein V3C99_018695 [Haemonchus contortus]
MPSPNLTNYYEVFVTEMRQLRAPLNSLLNEDAPCNWNSDCDAGFERTKEVHLLLTHYNPSLPTADASDYGIEVVISHPHPNESENAVYYASRFLGATEKNNGQIEKEGLAFIYAARMFHRYVYGRHFTLFTDHKPPSVILELEKGLPTYTAIASNAGLPPCAPTILTSNIGVLPATISQTRSLAPFLLSRHWKKTSKSLKSPETPRPSSTTV